MVGQGLTRRIIKRLSKDIWRRSMWMGFWKSTKLEDFESYFPKTSNQGRGINKINYRD